MEPGESVHKMSACYLDGTPRVAALTASAFYLVATDVKKPIIGRVPLMQATRIEGPAPGRPPDEFTIVAPDRELRFERVQDRDFGPLLIEFWHRLKD
ncbi:MAG: hypothetical protein ACXV8R_16910 [Acidimicrobiia bacterium]